MKVRTALSRPYPARQTNNEQLFSKIRTESRQRTENQDRIRTVDRQRARFSGKSGQKRNKNRTRKQINRIFNNDIAVFEKSILILLGQYIAANNIDIAARQKPILILPISIYGPYFNIGI